MFESATTEQFHNGNGKFPQQQQKKQFFPLALHRRTLNYNTEIAYNAFDHNLY